VRTAEIAPVAAVELRDEDIASQADDAFASVLGGAHTTTNILVDAQLMVGSISDLAKMPEVKAEGL
jgi:hypothetical protein